jgi:hypothetical protein
MSKTTIMLTFLIAIAVNAHAQSPNTKRTLGGLGASMSEWADRQAALDAEIELAKAKAAIEVDTQRKLQAIRTNQAPQRNPDQETEKLRQRHPQWVGILNSTIFKSWLRTRPNVYQDLCMSTPEAAVMGSCIDDFFNAKILQVQ